MAMRQRRPPGAPRRLEGCKNARTTILNVRRLLNRFEQSRPQRRVVRSQTAGRVFDGQRRPSGGGWLRLEGTAAILAARMRPGRGAEGSAGAGRPRRQAWPPALAGPARSELTSGCADTSGGFTARTRGAHRGRRSSQGRVLPADDDNVVIDAREGSTRFEEASWRRAIRLAGSCPSPARWRAPGCVLPSAALAAPGDFASSFEPGDPQPAWIDTVEGDRASGVAGPARPPGEIPGNQTDKVIAVRASARERGLRRGRGEPRRRLAADEVARLRAHRLGRVRVLRAVRGRPLRADVGQRRGGARPARLDALGLERRHDLDRARRAVGPGLRGALPDQGVPVQQHDRVPPLPARLHRQPRRRPDPARRGPALQRRHLSPAALRPPEPHRQRPARRLRREVRRRLHRAEGAALRRHAHRRRPRLHLQQGLRRRRAGAPAQRALLRRLSRLRRGRPALPEHVRRGRPRVHRRHVSERPRRDRPARRDAQPARPGRLQDALHEPVELQALAHRRGRGRQDDRPRADRLRQPGRPDGVRRLVRRHPHRGGPGAPRALAALGLGRHEPRHPLDQQLLARQQHPRHRGAARLQLLDPGDERRQPELALRLPPRQQRGEQADARRVRGEPRAEPVDGRAPDVPGHALEGGGRAAAGARRARARVPPRGRDHLAAPLRREVRERDQDGHRAHQPRGAVPLHVPRRRVEPRLRQRQRRRVADDRSRRTAS